MIIIIIIRVAAGATSRVLAPLWNCLQVCLQLKAIFNETLALLLPIASIADENRERVPNRNNIYIYIYICICKTHWYMYECRELATL